MTNQTKKYAIKIHDDIKRVSKIVDVTAIRNRLLVTTDIGVFEYVSDVLPGSTSAYGYIKSPSCEKYIPLKEATTKDIPKSILINGICTGNIYLDDPMWDENPFKEFNYERLDLYWELYKPNCFTIDELGQLQVSPEPAIVQHASLFPAIFGTDETKKKLRPLFDKCSKEGWFTIKGVAAGFDDHSDFLKIQDKKPMDEMIRDTEKEMAEAGFK